MAGSAQHWDNTGMGVVYRAADSKLKRPVAIKVLPPALAADHDRLARFQREAEVLASLNHSNIAGIYSLEESGGVTALVMELVEGEDLSQRIAKGVIPLDEALPIAKQIARRSKLRTIKGLASHRVPSSGAIQPPAVAAIRSASRGPQLPASYS